MKAKRNICIAPYGGQWAIRREGDTRILHVMACAEDAKELAFDVARQEGVQVRLQQSDGHGGNVAALPLPSFAPTSWPALPLHTH